MKGVVLCGGKSSRMGTDKGLLKLEARTWAQTAVDKLSVLGLPIVLSVNQQQHPDYAAVFPELPLVIDDGGLDIHGPLAGVLSIHEQFPEEDIFILACDMPLMDTAMLRKLYACYSPGNNFDAYIFTSEGEAEPLCGIYTSRGLALTINLHRNNALPKHSMKFMLEHFPVLALPLQEGEKKYFRNFNAHAELNGL